MTTAYDETQTERKRGSVIKCQPLIADPLCAMGPHGPHGPPWAPMGPHGPLGSYGPIYGPSGPIFHFPGPSGPIFHFSGPCGAYLPFFGALRGISLHFSSPAGPLTIFFGPCGASDPDFSGPAGPQVPWSRTQDPKEKKRIPEKKCFRPPAESRKKRFLATFFFHRLGIMGAQVCAKVAKRASAVI